MYPEFDTVQAIQRDRRRQLESQAASHRLMRTSTSDVALGRPRRSRPTRRWRWLSLARGARDVAANPVPRPASIH